MLIPPVTDEYSFILKPSNLEGIGVFAVDDIPEYAILDLFDPNEPVRILDQSEVSNKHFLRFGVKQSDGKWSLPTDFRRMSVGWYLNHSREPNVITYDDYAFYSTRNIKAGEELLIDYRTLETEFSEETDEWF